MEFPTAQVSSSRWAMVLTLVRRHYRPFSATEIVTQVGQTVTNVEPGPPQTLSTYFQHVLPLAQHWPPAVQLSPHLHCSERHMSGSAPHQAGDNFSCEVKAGTIRDKLSPVLDTGGKPLLPLVSACAALFHPPFDFLVQRLPRHRPSGATHPLVQRIGATN